MDGLRVKHRQQALRRRAVRFARVASVARRYPWARSNRRGVRHLRLRARVSLDRSDGAGLDGVRAVRVVARLGAGPAAACDRRRRCGQGKGG